jgi:hypothetical protein
MLAGFISQGTTAHAVSKTRLRRLVDDLNQALSACTFVFACVLALGERKVGKKQLEPRASRKASSDGGINSMTKS